MKNIRKFLINIFILIVLVIMVYLQYDFYKYEKSNKCLLNTAYSHKPSEKEIYEISNTLIKDIGEFSHEEYFNRGFYQKIFLKRYYKDAHNFDKILQNSKKYQNFSTTDIDGLYCMGEIGIQIYYDNENYSNYSFINIFWFQESYCRSIYLKNNPPNNKCIIQQNNNYF